MFPFLNQLNNTTCNAQRTIKKRMHLLSLEKLHLLSRNHTTTSGFLAWGRRLFLLPRHLFFSLFFPSSSPPLPRSNPLICHSPRSSRRPFPLLFSPIKHHRFTCRFPSLGDSGLDLTARVKLVVTEKGSLGFPIDLSLGIFGHA